MAAATSALRFSCPLIADPEQEMSRARKMFRLENSRVTDDQLRVRLDAYKAKVKEWAEQCIKTATSHPEWQFHVVGKGPFGFSLRIWFDGSTDGETIKEKCLVFRSKVLKQEDPMVFANAQITGLGDYRSKLAVLANTAIASVGRALQCRVAPGGFFIVLEVENKEENCRTLGTAMAAVPLLDFSSHYFYR